MKLKTLLFSSAAAIVVAGGATAAQAADLSVAEPVSYVKVCDAFGAGYWYIPGSDTCIKIGGLVRMDVNFHSTKLLFNSSAKDHSAGWDFATEAHLNVTAKSMTEYGPLTAFIEFRALGNPADKTNQVESYDNKLSGNRFAYMDSAWLQLGMLTVGQKESIYHYYGGYTYMNGDFDAGDNNVEQIALNWSMSGMGIQLAIEDPRGRWGSNLKSTYSMPDIVGALTWSGKWGDAQLSGGYGETSAGSGFGAQIGATFKLDQIAPGDKLALQAAWAQSEVATFGAGSSKVDSGGSVWSALLGFQHFWAPTLSSSADFEYMSESGTSVAANSFNGWEAALNLVWSPVTNFSAGIEGQYQKMSNASTGTWAAKIRLERDW